MFKLTNLTKNQIKQRVDAALGRVPCDLIIRRVKFLDVFSCQWREGDISVSGGVIVGIEPGLKANRVIDGKDRWLVPGFIDAHVHVESSLLVPGNFERAVLPKGTTTAICDPHELANVMGLEGIEFFLDSAEQMSLDLRVMLSSCVPSTNFETNGGGEINSTQLVTQLFHPKALGLAEMMNVPGVLNGDSEILTKLESFSHGPIDGHCPLVTGQELSAYAAAGISSCHESSRLEEAMEKLSKGMSVWIREGSVAKDMNTLAPILNMATSTTVGFCTDDRNPLDIANEGHIDHLVRGVIRTGVPPAIAYRSASWTVARHYGLARKAAIAPGYGADLVLLDDATSCSIAKVFKDGVPIEELSSGLKGVDIIQNSVRAVTPETVELKAPEGRVHVIGVRHGRIITDRHVMNHDDPGVARLTVLERYGKESRPSNAYVTGFGRHFKGAIASSVAHDSHNLIAVADTPENMRVALAALIESGGGFCVVKDGQVAGHLPLPFGGLMSNLEPHEIADSLRKLQAASRATGCELPEPFLQLAFLSLPVIPSLKLTDRGLVDVEAFKIIDVRAA